MATDTTTKSADLSDILAKLKLTDPKTTVDQPTIDQLDSYLRQPNIDFSNATDQELQNYQNALDYYKNYNGTTKTPSLDDVVSLVQQKLNQNVAYGTPNAGGSVLLQRLKPFIQSHFQNGKLQPITPSEGSNLLLDSQESDVYNKFIEDLNNQIKGLGTAGQPNFDDTLSNNQKTIQSLQSSRGQTSSDQQAVTDYLANAPQQLTQSRNDFYNQQRASAQDYLKTNVIPKNIEPIERSGLASDREIASMIANLYGGVQSSLDQSESAQAIADVNFFSDAAYKTKLQALINTHGDVQSQISSDYNTARTQQQQGFQTAQSKLQNDFDVNLFKQQNQQALDEYNTKLKQQQDMQSKQSQSNLFSAIGSTAGMIGGAVVTGGSPIGAMAGQTVGSIAGGAA